MFLTSEEFKEGGSALLGGSGVFTVPAGVASISVVGIEGGNTGNGGAAFVNNVGGVGGTGGLGGRRRYVNDVPVTPGQQISYSIGPGSFSFGSVLTGTSGGVDAGRASQGSQGGSASSLQTTYGTGGGPGQGASYYDTDTDYSFLTPLGNANSSAAIGSYPGGGGGGGHSGINLQGNTSGLLGAAGGDGAIYVLWPGDARQFPSLRTPPEIAGDNIFDPRGIPASITKTATDKAGTWIGIDTSDIAGQRGRIFRSTDNGRSWNQIQIPKDAQLAGVAYGSSVFIVALAKSLPFVSNQYGLLISSDGGSTWVYSTVAQTANNASQVDLSFSAGRFFLINDEVTQNANKMLTSDNAGSTWTPRLFLAGGSDNAIRAQARIINYSNIGVVIRRANGAQAYLSRDNGASFAQTNVMDAVKLGTTTIALNIGQTRIYTSTDDLSTSTQYTGITLTAPAALRFLSLLQDRVLIHDGAITYQYKDGVFSTAKNMPMALAADFNASYAPFNPAPRFTTDGFISLIHIARNDKSASFRSSIYVG